MKKLFLFSLLFAFCLNMNGQEKKGEKSNTTTEKSTKSKKEAKTKVPLKKDGTPDKRYKTSQKENVPLKKDGTPDKRYNASTKESKTSTTGQKKAAEGKANPISNKAKTKYKKETHSNEKAPKKKDKVTGKYKGKTVYTGPRGGEYYINSNGNKTYITD